MKTFITTLSKQTIMSCALTGIILLQIGCSYQIVAQNNINIANPLQSSFNNVNDPVQSALINNGSKINSPFSRSINVTSVKKRTTNPVKKSYVTPISKTQTKSTAKPINKQLAVNYKPKQIVKPKQQLQQPQKKVQAVVSAQNQPVLVIQQLNKPVVNEVGNVLVNLTQEVISNTVVVGPPLQSGNQIIVNTKKIKTYALSGGSGSAKKTTQRISSSKRKSINHFRYSTNKKIIKLLARTKKNKIDPARCFVWS